MFGLLTLEGVQCCRAEAAAAAVALQQAAMWLQEPWADKIKRVENKQTRESNIGMQ
jgi:hypothetical protein